MNATLFDQLWDRHVIADLGDDTALLHVDRHLVHDLAGRDAFAALRQRGLAVHSPELTFATPDHVVSSLPGRTGREQPWAAELVDALRQGSHEFGVRLFDLGQAGHGIVHVIGPELGLTLPGLLLLCGDSHTSTHGALGALAWGIGASEIVHVLATQTLVQKRPRRMRIRFTGELQRGVQAKDLALAMIARLGAAAGTGYAVEYAGPVIERLTMAGRQTLCNMSIEMGARTGLIAPDQTTFDWLHGRPHAPRGAGWERALADWRGLRSAADAVFEREETIAAGEIAPQITWGTSPEQAIAIDGRVPDPAQAAGPARAQATQQALDYMGLAPGQTIAGTRVDRIFIGSCTNSRLEDLRAAADLVRGGRVAAHVSAWVVPGSEGVRRAAEAEGLHQVFAAAGFEWRSPGCSLCVGANGELVAPGQRSVSTSNRNFVGRQGPGARTHLASPTVAAACALAGCIVDHLARRAFTTDRRMTPLTVLEGVAAPLPLANVDTDVIIRIEKLARVPREELGRWAFEPLRYQGDGSENPGFVLNQSGWRGAPLLVAGPNFGCGSSREQAVWALQSLGIRCVIAPSFGDIFRGNCFQNGVLPLQLAASEAQWLLDALERRRQHGEAVALRLDLAQRTLAWPGERQWSFALDERRRQALLQGLDEIGMTRLLLPRIVQWQDRDRTQRPWVWQAQDAGD